MSFSSQEQGRDFIAGNFIAPTGTGEYLTREEADKSYAKKGEYLTKEAADSAYMSKDTQVITSDDLEGIQGKIESLEGDSESLTAEVDALKTDTVTKEEAKGFLKAETDPTVPAWAKADSKPNYTYSEIEGAPTKVGDLENDKDYQTKTQVQSIAAAKVADVVAGAPESFDTLKELSDWIDAHEDSAAAMNSQISDIQKAVDANKASIDSADTKYVKTTDPRLTDARPASDVSAWAKASTKPSYTADEVGAVGYTNNFTSRAGDKPGWYRIAKIQGKVMDYRPYTSGILILSSFWAKGMPTSAVIAYSQISTSIKAKVLASQVNSETKVRFVDAKDGNNGMYIDVYSTYNGTANENHLVPAAAFMPTIWCDFTAYSPTEPLAEEPAESDVALELDLNDSATNEAENQEENQGS